MLLSWLQVLDILQQDAENPVVLSGDIHNAFVWRLFRDTASTPVRAAPLGCHLPGSATDSAGPFCCPGPSGLSVLGNLRLS